MFYKDFKERLCNQMVGCRIKEYLYKHRFKGISYYIKVVIVSCLKLKISITTKPNGFSSLGRIHIGTLIVLG